MVVKQFGNVNQNEQIGKKGFNKNLYKGIAIIIGLALVAAFAYSNIPLAKTVPINVKPTNGVSGNPAGSQGGPSGIQQSVTAIGSATPSDDIKQENGRILKKTCVASENNPPYHTCTKYEWVDTGQIAPQVNNAGQETTQNTANIAGVEMVTTPWYPLTIRRTIHVNKYNVDLDYTYSIYDREGYIQWDNPDKNQIDHLYDTVVINVRYRDTKTNQVYNNVKPAIDRPYNAFEGTATFKWEESLDPANTEWQADFGLIPGKAPETPKDTI